MAFDVTSDLIYVLLDSDSLALQTVPGAVAGG
jgi:hypothetical protein